MKPVTGLSRPGAQWALVVGTTVLIAVLWWAIVELREARTTARRAADEIETPQRERAALEADLARERATREALALELGRLRSAGGGSDAAAPPVPTLTLTPGTSPSGAAPESTVAAPAPAQAVELRLLLSTGAPKLERAQVVARDWSSGDVKWTITGRVAVVEGRQMVRAFVTGEMLAAGTYEVQVRAERDETLAVYQVGIRNHVP